MDRYSQIQDLLKQRAECLARLKQMPYDGTPEIKLQGEYKYLYVRKRVAGRLTSTYVGPFSDELYQMLVRNAKESKELNKAIRKINKELLSFGYEEKELSSKVALNLDFARSNMKINIYDQAVLEGVGTTLPQTETIIDNGKVSGVSVSDIQKILNLKHAWEFILDNDVIQCESNFHVLSYIAKLVNEGFYYNGGSIRKLPVSIGGSNYIPSIPNEHEVMLELYRINNQKKDAIDIAIDLCLYCMRTQIFIDGNKRVSVIFANHYLISKGKGLLVIPERYVSEFKKLLVKYYESNDNNNIKKFLKEKCWKEI